MPEAGLAELADQCGLIFLGSLDLRSGWPESGGPAAGRCREAHGRWLADGCQAGMAWLADNAGKRLDPGQVMPGTDTLLLFGMPFAAVGEDGPIGGHGPAGQAAACSVASYADGRDYHKLFRKKIGQVIDGLPQAARPAVRRILIDANPLAERFFATLTGAGFIGRNTMFILPGTGSRVFLGTVLAVRPGDGTLEARPPVAVPAPGGGCPPECRRCLDACPTGALGPDGHGAWRLDARLCLSWQGIESGLGIPAACREANGTRLFGCEACLDACPFNHPNPGPGQIPLAEALSWDEPAAFTKRFAGTSLMRAGWRQVLSNACVAAGNLADVALRERLLELCGFPDPLIAGHARWAVDRMTKNKPG